MRAAVTWSTQRHANKLQFSTEEINCSRLITLRKTTRIILMTHQFMFDVRECFCSSPPQKCSSRGQDRTRDLELSQAQRHSFSAIPRRMQSASLPRSIDEVWLTIPGKTESVSIKLASENRMTPRFFRIGNTVIQHRKCGGKEHGILCEPTSKA